MSNLQWFLIGVTLGAILGISVFYAILMERRLRKLKGSPE